MVAGAMQLRQIASIGSLSHPHKNTKYELWMKRQEENRLQVEEAEEGEEGMEDEEGRWEMERRGRKGEESLDYRESMHNVF